MEKQYKIVQFQAQKKDDGTIQRQLQRSNYMLSRSGLSSLLKLSIRDLRNLLVVNSIIEPRDKILIVSVGDLNTVISENSIYIIYEDLPQQTDFIQKFNETFNQIQDLEFQTEFETQFELLSLETLLYYQIDCLTQIHNNSKYFALSINSQKSETVEGQTALTQSQQILTQNLTDCQRLSLTLENLIDNQIDLGRLAFINQQQINVNEDSSQFSQEVDELPFNIDLITDMVESYLFQIRALTLETSETIQLIKSQMNLAELHLDNNRNALMTFELKLTFITASLDLCCMFGGLWGMNVPVPFSEYKYSWIYVVVMEAALTLLFLMFLTSLERKGKNNVRKEKPKNYYS